MKEPNERPPDRNLSHHILPNAATMVGICPTLIGIIKLTEATSGVLRRADECLGVITVLFVISAITSYFSVRDHFGRRHSERLERVADVFFIVGLIGLAGCSLLFAYEWI